MILHTNDLGDELSRGGKRQRDAETMHEWKIVIPNGFSIVKVHRIE